MGKRMQTLISSPVSSESFRCIWGTRSGDLGAGSFWKMGTMDIFVLIVLWLDNSSKELSLVLTACQYSLSSSSYFWYKNGEGWKLTFDFRGCWWGHEFLLLGICHWSLFTADETFQLLIFTLGWSSKNSPKAVHMYFEGSFEHQMALTKEGFLSTECEGEHDSKGEKKSHHRLFLR